MVKLVPKRLAIPLGMVTLRARYHPTFIEEMKAWPGPRYAPEIGKGVWLIPAELATEIGKRAHHYHLDPQIAGHQPRLELATIDAAEKAKTEQFYPHQIEGAQWLAQNSAGLLAWETGVGKGPTAILAARLVQAETVLIVCPAGMRQTWADEIRRWWPMNGQINVVESGAEWEAWSEIPDQINVTICSYGLLEACPKSGWDCIIFDECHYLKNGRAIRSKWAATLVEDSPKAVRIGLSATPIGNRPEDLHQQLDILFPQRFGTWWKFTRRYCRVEHNGYGEELTGPNDENYPELVKRLGHVAHRVSKAQVAHLMPCFQATALRYPTKDPALIRLAQKWLASAPIDSCTVAEEAIREAAKPKIAVVLERLVEIKEAASDRFICILTHLRTTAKSIAKSIEQDPKTFGPVIHIDGEIAPAERKRIIEASLSAETEGLILVATKHSVKEGVNFLTPFTRVLVAELCYSPLIEIQSAGRFSRLNSTVPSLLEYIIFDGTLDEIIAKAVLDKLNAINQTFKSGANETQIEKALTKVETDAEFFARIREVAAKTE